MTALGLAVAALFFFVSRAEPLEKLSAERPPSRIFCLQVCLSIVGQFLVHLVCLMRSLELAKPLVARTRADPSFAPDGPFRPNVVNTAIFLLSAATQVGERWMELGWIGLFGVVCMDGLDPAHIYKLSTPPTRAIQYTIHNTTTGQHLHGQLPREALHAGAVGQPPPSLLHPGSLRDPLGAGPRAGPPRQRLPPGRCV